MKWFLTENRGVLALAVFVFSFLSAFAAAPTTSSAYSDSTAAMRQDTTRQDTTRQTIYQRHTQRMKRDWARLVPNQQIVQFAGSIGMFSIGTGWHYGRRDQLETELLFGYLPHKNGSEHHYTLTLKQRYIPWRVPLSAHSQRWVLEPLTCGGFVNTIFGEGFWRHEPSKYTKGYYGFNTKLRYNLFIGQRIKYNIPHRHRIFNKSITAYYELSTCDLYVVSAVPNSRVSLIDILSLAVGLKMDIF